MKTISHSICWIELLVVCFIQICKVCMSAAEVSLEQLTLLENLGSSSLLCYLLRTALYHRWILFADAQIALLICHDTIVAT